MFFADADIRKQLATPADLRLINFVLIKLFFLASTFGADFIEDVFAAIKSEAKSSHRVFALAWDCRDRRREGSDER